MSLKNLIAFPFPFSIFNAGMIELKNPMKALYKKQKGYLLEIPLILSLVIILLAALLPILPEIAAKLLAVIATPVIIGCLHYMIVTPGWQPGQRFLLGRRLRLLAFFVVSGFVVFLTGVFLLS